MNNFYKTIIMMVFCASCGTSPEMEDAKNSYFERHIAGESESLTRPAIKEESPVKSDALDSQGPVEAGHATNQDTEGLSLPDAHAHGQTRESETSRTPNGPCDLELARQIIYRENHEFAEQMYNCVLQDTWNFTANLNIDCLAEKYPDVNYECLTCFERFTKCAASNCKADCAPTWLRGYGDRSIECKKCTWFYCGDAMKQCSGIPLARIPDFQR